MDAGFSVLVTSWNGASRLPAALAAIAAQRAPSDLAWEVVVVDNASTDGTAELARRSWPRNAPAPIRVVTEPTPGVLHANLRGLSEVRFALVGLVNDDNRPEPGWLRSAAESLRAQGFAVDTAASVSEGLRVWRAADYDAAVLDLMLPDGTGLDALKEMRDRGNVTPVLILTALGAIEDRVRGLDCGADDYLVKPFAMQELIARLRALLRRPGAALGRTLTLGSVKLDTSARIVTVAETPLDLTRSELIVLEALLRNQGRVVSKERLAECLYDFEQERSANSVETQVHRLRKKLAAAGADVSLRTLRGLGYLAS